MVVKASLLLLAILAVSGSPLALANGATIEVLQKSSGPFRITVGAIPIPPQAGFVHMTVTVAERGTLEPVTDAEVRVFVQREGEGRRGEALLLNSPTAPEYYDANVDVPRAGTWLFSLEVTADQGKATVDFSLEVEGQPPSLAGQLAWSVLVVVIILGAVYVWWTIRRSRLRRRPQG